MGHRSSAFLPHVTLVNGKTPGQESKGAWAPRYPGPGNRGKVTGWQGSGSNPLGARVQVLRVAVAEGGDISALGASSWEPRALGPVLGA